MPRCRASSTTTRWSSLAPYNHSNINRDTFHPVSVTREASRLEDENYPFSWLPPDDADQHARELSERGPEASPIDAF